MILGAKQGFSINCPGDLQSPIFREGDRLAVFWPEGMGLSCKNLRLKVPESCTEDIVLKVFSDFFEKKNVS